MFCTKCGAQLADGMPFCTQCGSPTGASAPIAQQPAAQQPVVQQPVAQVQQQVPQQAQQPMYGAAPQQPYVQQPGTVPAPQPTARGCFGSGWDDVKGSEGWFKKVALMALIDMVPIFNFVCAGYGWRWGKDVVLGKREGLPQKIVSSDNFKLGFFIFVVGLLFGVAMWIQGFVLGFVPVLGILAAIALGFFASMFVNLSYIRVALFESLGACFELGKLFEGYKRKLGTLFCIAVVPGLVAAGIGIVIFLVFSLLAGAIAGTDFLSIMASSSYRGSSSYLPYYLLYNMRGSIVIVLLLYIVATYFVLIAAQFCQLVTQRAMGHYVARFVPEWGPEAAAAGAMAQTGTPQMPTQPYAPYGQQPAASSQLPAAAPMAAPVAAPVQQQMAAPAAAPVAQAPVAQAPVASTPASYGAAAAPAAAVGAAAGAAATAASAATQAEQERSQELEQYAFAETSVLPEMPEDMDTIVQPELLERGPSVTSSQSAPTQSGAEPQQAAPAEDGAVRLQPTVASGPLVGDDSSTMVLMEDAQSIAATTQVAPAAGQRTLQLTRANGDTCMLTTFPVTIGKGSEADLVIDGNGTISRVHVRILRDGDTFAAEDLGSTNKTFIGTYELPPHTPTILTDGDELRLANELLRISIV